MKPLTEEQKAKTAYVTERMCFRQVLKDGKKIHECKKWILVRPDGSNVINYEDGIGTEIRKYVVLEDSDISADGDIIDGDLRVLIMYCD